MKKTLHFLKNNLFGIFLGCLLLWILFQNFMDQFIWKTGMAFHMNTVPFFFYIVIFMTLPFFLVEKIYKNKYTDLEETPYHQKCASPKDVGKILFGGILKLALAIVFPFVLLILSSFLCTIFLKDVIDIEKAYIFNSDFQYLPLAAGLGLFLMLIWLFSKKGIVARDYSDNAKIDLFAQGEKAHLPRPVKYRIALISTLLFLLTLFIPCCSYDCITENGVIRHCFFYNKTYTWEDAKYYSLRSVNKGSLTFLIEMEDGHTVFWDSSLSSNLPEAAYPNQEYDFFVYLAETLHEHGVPLYVKHWDRFYNNLGFEEDMQYALKIKEISEGN